MFEYSGFSSNEERRRRLLSETLGDDSTSESPARARSARPHSGSAGRLPIGSRYPKDGFLDRQPRLTDLIPTRLWVCALIFLAGLGVIAGLEALYCWMPRFSQVATDGRIAAFDLDGEGSLAVWVSSMTLALAAMVAAVIYTVRRHRIDDYQGYYRIWLWAAACWLVMSVDETGSLHEGFKEMMAHATGTRLSGDGSLWWVAPYFLVLAAVGLRLLADMRDCLLAAAAFLATAVCYAAAVAFQLGWIMPESGARGVMFEEGAELLGDLLLLMSMLLYARFVILEAQGCLQPSRRNTAAVSGSEQVQSTGASGSRVEPAHSIVVRPPRGIRVPASSARQTADIAPSEPASGPTRRKSALALFAGWFGKRATVGSDPEGDPQTDDASEQAESQSPATTYLAPAIRPTEPQGSISTVPVQPLRSSSESASESATRRLSKAERKAMRRRLQQLRAERERRLRDGP